MVELSPEELERIKLEELRKIEELERHNQEKKLRLQQELKKIEEAKQEKSPQASSDINFDKAREEIRHREMLARGYIEYEGQWMPREEAERQKKAAETKVREEEDKINRAKQRKIEREKQEFEEYLASVILHVKVYSMVIYGGLGTLLIGIIMVTIALTQKAWMATFFFPGAFFTTAGAILTAMFFYFLMELETKIIEKSVFIIDDEINKFENEEEITDYVRKTARYAARRIHKSLSKEV